jgi:cardiolipin synthase
VVCDGRIGFTGGINVSDNHSGAHSGSAAWRDTHLRIEGEPVHRLQFIFLEDWYFATDHAPRSNRNFFRVSPQRSTGPWLQIIESGPDDNRHAIAKLLFRRHRRRAASDFAGHARTSFRARR